MIPYFLLLIFPAILYFVFIGTTKYNRKTVLIGYESRTPHHNLALPAFFAWLTILLVLRSIDVGRDLFNYRIIFLRDSAQSISEIIRGWDDPLFKLFNYAFFRITDDFQWYIAFTSLITILPIAYVYCKDRSHPFIKIAVFLSMSTFWFLFSGIRQSMAISLGVLGFELIRRKKTAWFFVVAALATLIHASGFMVFALYPLYYFRFKRKHLYFIVPAIALVFIFNKPIFSFLAGIFASVYDKEIVLSPSDAFGSLILFALLTAMVYLFMDERRMAPEDYALRNILLLTVALQCFAPLHVLAMRMNYYFIIFMPLAIGRTFSITSEKYARLAKITEIALCIFFMARFCLSVYTSFQTGESALDTIPYIPFWEQAS